MVTGSDSREEKVLASLIRLVGGSFLPLGFLGRLPFAMTVVGILTLVATTRGSYAEAGLASGAVGVGSIVFGPLVGGLADARGQRLVVGVCAVANAAFLGAVVALTAAGAGLPALLLAAFFVGATSPQMGSMVRARWLALIGGAYDGVAARRRIGSVMSYESMADELVFVFGPVVVGLLASLIGPEAPLVIAAVLTLVFVGAFALHPTAAAARRHGSGSTRAAPASALFTPRVLLPVGGMICIGMFFGSALTALTAFMARYAEESQTGILYGAMGLGSALLALAIGLAPERFALRDRWIVTASVAVAAAAFLPWIASVPAMALVLFLSGCGIGPTLVTLFSIGSRESPAGRSTTVMAMLGSGVVLGQSAASVATGLITQAHGYQAGFLAVLVAAALLLVLAGVNRALHAPPRLGREGEDR